MENDLILYSINAVRSMEVIDISSGIKLGYVRDFKIDVNEQRIISLLLPSPVKSWFGKEANIEIPWEKVVRTGVDVLLVDGSDLQKILEEKNI